MNSMCPHARAPRLRAGAVVAFASLVLSCARPVQAAGGPVPCAPATLAATDGVWALFDTSDFPPRWHCGNWTTLHGIVHVVADLAIWGAYTSIPLALVYFVRRRRDTPFPRLYWLFALFILSCGTGHLVEAGIFWWPAYRLSGAVKVITAVVSWVTVIALLPIIPRALAIPGISLLNAELSRELARRREVEAALAEREARLNAIVTASADAIITTDSRGRIQTLNPTAMQMLGCAGTTAAGTDLLETIVPDAQRDRLRDALDVGARARVGEFVLRAVELPLQGHSVAREFLAEVSVARIARDGPCTLAWQIHDVGERRRADDRFRLAVEAAPNGMVMVDASGAIIMVNSRTENMFGYSRQELLGQPVELLIPEALRSGHVEQRVRYMEHPEPRAMGSGRDLYARHRDGRQISVEVGLNPIITREGCFVLAAVVDVSERKRLEAELSRRAEQLQRQNEELTRRNAELDEFTHIASHDLQEPLRQVTSFGKLLTVDIGGDLPEAAARDLEFVVDGAARMQRLIRDLLELSRAGRAQLRSERFRLDECVDEVLERLAAAIGENGAQVTRDPLPTMLGDRVLMTQLYQNLIGNAMKFVPTGRAPVIHLSAVRNARGGWVMAVRDNGIGIKPEYHESIFAPFKRLHGRAEYPGSGIGLAICRKAVERHGGRIWVESTLDRGASFCFELGPGCEVKSEWNDQVENPPSSCWSTTTPGTRS